MYNLVGHHEPGSTKRNENVTVVICNEEINKINDYMVCNLLACVFCCWCIGAYAVYKSNDCRKSKLQGDLEGAQYDSKMARNMLQFTIIGGVITGLLLGIFLHNRF